MGSPTTMSLPSMPAAALFRMNRREALDNQRLAAGVGPIPWRGVHSDVHLSATWRDIEGGRAEHRVPSARFSDRHWITTRPPASFAEREKNRKLRSERPADACDGGESSAYRMAVERALLACLPGVPLWLICSSRSSRELIWNSGARPAEAIYNNRKHGRAALGEAHKEWRAVAIPTKRPPPLSWACSAWPPALTGSTGERLSYHRMNGVSGAQH